ncbi:hypothetical protein CIK06_07880 [Plantactinospora sp. KBS50]|nr:hypothetical protein CIK06_07880 [Plantactinospora sp. KBS50]
MRRLGRLAGGPVDLVQALRTVLGPDGTIVVPTFTEGNSLSSRAYRSATRGLSPASSVDHQSRMPGFDRRSTPSEGMGAFAETIRRNPAARRSAHPQSSFAALGPSAAGITDRHPLDCHLGERSPLGRLYDLDAHVLLAGVGFQVCSALHLAEYRLPAPGPARRTYTCFQAEAGRRVRREFTDIELDDSDFGSIGRRLDLLPFVRRGPLGRGTARLLPLRPAVDFAVGWLTVHRTSQP